MSTSLNIGGLSSGVQWNDIVDTTMKALEARQLTPITARITARGNQRDAWTTLQKLVETLNTNARALRRTGFGGFSATVPPSPSTSRTLLAATPTASATAGRYRVEVLQLADTAKLAGRAVADVAAARNQSGSFSINGTAITVDAADSLQAIRTKINDANAGVTATIVSEGGTAGRLVITSNTAGATGVSVADGTGGMARELGLLDTRSRPISSSTISAAAAMGMAVFPQPAQIRVGNVVVTAARINAAGGSATVESKQFGEALSYRLAVDGNVSAVAGDPNSQAVLDALGFQAGLAGPVRQTVQSGVFTDSGNAPMSTASSLVGLSVGGVSSGLAAGDAINFRGTRGDGTAVSFGLVVQPGDTMQSLLNRLNDVGNGFGAGARPAVAGLGADGRIRLTDGTSGPSRLSLNLSVTRADGSTTSLGAATTSVTGRNRELQNGRDAVIRVDGQEFVRTSNNITDAISGVNLNLLTAEPGATIDVTIDRDVKGATDAVKAFRDSYNEIRKFFDEQRVPDAALYADSSLRRVVDSFTEALRTPATGNATYASTVSVGLLLDRNGLLTFNEDTFRTAMSAAPAEVENLFGLTGLGTAFVNATDNATRFGTGTISLQLDTIRQNTFALRRREADAQKRLDLRRQQLVQQYTRMEEAMARLQKQSGSLLASVQGLQGNRQ
jgi:flagellar hook-associated protein 2